MSNSNYVTDLEFTQLRYRVALIESRIKILEQKNGEVPVSAPTPPIATPPIATPPIATPPIATPPIATPPIATPPIATPPIATPPIATPPIATPPIATPPIATPPIATRSQAPSPNNAPAGNWLNDWENIIGGRLSLWIGALCLFLAVASLLAITWKTLPPPPPIVRVIFGFAASLGLLIAGQKLQSLSQRWFSEGLSGTGLAVGYLSAWAGGPYFELWPNEVHLFALSFWAVVGGTLAIRNNSRAMLILSAIGGFLTPILLSDNIVETKSHAPFLFYVLALNAGIVAVSTYKSWRESFYFSYVSTLILLVSWSLSASIGPIRWMVWAFFTLYSLLFLAGSLYDSFARRQPINDKVVAFIYSLTFIYTAASIMTLETGNGFFLLGMAAFFALLWRVSTTRLPHDNRISHTFAVLSLIFSIAFVPYQFKANFTTTVWFAQALGLAIMARRFNSILLRKGEVAVWSLGLIGLVVMFLDKMTTKAVWSSANAYPTDTLALTSFFALLVTGFMIFLAKRHNDKSYPPHFYASFVAWGGALFIMREIGVWNLKPLLEFGQYRFYLTASLCLIWSVAIFKTGIKQRLSTLELNGWCLFVLSLIAISLKAIIHIQKPLPLFNPREIAFLIGFGGIAVAYQTLSKVEIRQHTADARSLLSLTGLLWLVIGASIEVAGYFAPLHQVTTSSLWFVLCAMWAGFGFAGFLASQKMGEEYLKSLSLGIISAATCVLLWYSVVPTPTWSPLLNTRIGAFVIVWLCTFFSLRALYLIPQTYKTDVWQPWKLVISTSLMVLPLWLISLEAWHGGRILHASDDITTFIICAIWALFGCAGFYTAQRLGEYHLKVLSLGILSSAASILLLISLISVSTWTPITNIRAGAFAIVWLSVWSIRELIRRNEDIEKSDGWQWCELALSSTLLLLPLWAATQEIWNGAGFYKASFGPNYERYASLVISLFWSIYGALTLYSGVLRQDQNLRIAGLGLCALTICKVYLLDLSFLDGGLRVLSLAGLGGSLLFISWLYGRLTRQEIKPENQKRA